MSITATIKRNVPIQTRLDIKKPEGKMTFAAGVKPPRQRKSSTAWPSEFEGIKAPVQRFVNADGVDVQAIDSNGDALTSRDGEFFQNVFQEDGSKKLEKVDESEVQFADKDGNLWTLQGVQEVADYDYLQVSGTAEELQKVYNAVQRFSKATGKGLIVRHEKEETDPKGVVMMTKNIIRIR